MDGHCRGLGIGRALLLAVEIWSQVKGCLPIVVRANTGRKEAHLFYEKYGYSLQNQQKVYYTKIPPDLS